MAIAAKLKHYLDDRGVKYIHTIHSPAFTAQEVAAAERVKGRYFAKTVVVRAGAKKFALAVVPAERRVRLPELARAMGEARAELATEEEFEGLFPGCERGAMSPFGGLYGLEVYVDRALAADEYIVFNAGTHRDSIHMRYEDFDALAKPRVADFAERL